jgi:hypothetical protein
MLINPLNIKIDIKTQELMARRLAPRHQFLGGKEVAARHRKQNGTKVRKICHKMETVDKIIVSLKAVALLKNLLTRYNSLTSTITAYCGFE